jgi:hypothetical protein
MSGKRPSLAESMRQSVAVGPTPAALIPAPRASLPDPVSRPAGFYAATRAGKKKVTAALDPAAHRQIKNLATDRDTTVEALLNEAINDLFQKYGKPRTWK